MFAGGHGEALGVHAAGQGVNIGQHCRAEFTGASAGALRIGVQDADKLHPFKLAIDARVVTAEIADANYGNANAPILHRTFAPEGSLELASGALGCASSFASGAKASTAIPAWSAASIRRGRSKSKVRRASIARAVAWERRITSTVRNPMTGTSKLMSCSGLTALSTTSGLPAASRAAPSTG